MVSPLEEAIRAWIQLPPGISWWDGPVVVAPGSYRDGLLMAIYRVDSVPIKLSTIEIGYSSMRNREALLTQIERRVLEAARQLLDLTD
jgi:hypothetical protein